MQVLNKLKFKHISPQISSDHSLNKQHNGVTQHLEKPES